MPIYYVNIDVQFETPIDCIEPHGAVSKGDIKGYIREIGATFDSDEELKQVIENEVFSEWGSNGVVIYDHIGVIDEADIQKEIYEDEDICDSLIGDPRLRGVWYKTGRAFYNDDIDEDDFSEISLVPDSPFDPPAS